MHAQPHYYIIIGTHDSSRVTHRRLTAWRSHARSHRGNPSLFDTPHHKQTTNTHTHPPTHMSRRITSLSRRSQNNNKYDDNDDNDDEPFAEPARRCLSLGIQSPMPAVQQKSAGMPSSAPTAASSSTTKPPAGRTAARFVSSCVRACVQVGRGVEWRGAKQADGLARLPEADLVVVCVASERPAIQWW